MEKPFRILVVDDEKRILTFLKSKLKASGYEVVIAQNGNEALQQFHSQTIDLMVLDLVMPGMDGLQTLRELRGFSTVPVIVLSAKGSDRDKINGLELGADDYLAKPFNPDELVARIESVRRRLQPMAQPQPSARFSLGDISIDFDRRRVMVRGKEKKLTRIEWLLLDELTRNAGRLMLYDDLLTRVWGAEYRDDVQILRTWISRLREKLEDDPGNPKLIRTIPKSGYILETDAA